MNLEDEAVVFRQQPRRTAESQLPVIGYVDRDASLKVLVIAVLDGHLLHDQAGDVGGDGNGDGVDVCRDPAVVCDIVLVEEPFDVHTRVDLLTHIRFLKMCFKVVKPSSGSKCHQIAICHPNCYQIVKKMPSSLPADSKL